MKLNLVLTETHFMQSLGASYGRGLLNAVNDKYIRKVSIQGSMIVGNCDND